MFGNPLEKLFGRKATVIITYAKEEGKGIKATSLPLSLLPLSSQPPVMTIDSVVHAVIQYTAPKGMICKARVEISPDLYERLNDALSRGPIALETRIGGILGNMPVVYAIQKYLSKEQDAS